jgi:hypothetical protein
MILEKHVEWIKQPHTNWEIKSNFIEKKKPNSTYLHITKKPKEKKHLQIFFEKKPKLQKYKNEKSKKTINRKKIIYPHKKFIIMLESSTQRNSLWCWRWQSLQQHTMRVIVSKMKNIRNILMWRALMTHNNFKKTQLTKCKARNNK